MPCVTLNLFSLILTCLIQGCQKVTIISLVVISCLVGLSPLIHPRVSATRTDGCSLLILILKVPFCIHLLMGSFFPLDHHFHNMSAILCSSCSLLLQFMFVDSTLFSILYLLVYTVFFHIFICLQCFRPYIYSFTLFQTLYLFVYIVLDLIFIRLHCFRPYSFTSYLSVLCFIIFCSELTKRKYGNSFIG